MFERQLFYLKAKTERIDGEAEEVLKKARVS